MVWKCMSSLSLQTNIIPFAVRQYFKRFYNLKKTGLNGYIFDFFADYNTIKKRRWENMM